MTDQPIAEDREPTDLKTALIELRHFRAEVERLRPFVDMVDQAQRDAERWERAAEENGKLYSAAENQRDDAREAITELAQAIRLTREYVGAELLPAVEGWSWYDALKKWAPHELPAPACNCSQPGDGECPCPPKCGCCTVTMATPAPAQQLRDQIAAAIHRYDNEHALSGNDIPSVHHRGEADAVLAVPAIRALTETRDALRVTEGDRDAAATERQQLRDELEDVRHNLALRAFTAPDADFETILTSLDARIRDALNPQQPPAA